MSKEHWDLPLPLPPSQPIREQLLGAGRGGGGGGCNTEPTGQCLRELSVFVLTSRTQWRTQTDREHRSREGEKRGEKREIKNRRGRRGGLFGVNPFSLCGLFSNSRSSQEDTRGKCRERRSTVPATLFVPPLNPPGARLLFGTKKEVAQACSIPFSSKRPPLRGTFTQKQNHCPTHSRG